MKTATFNTAAQRQEKALVELKSLTNRFLAAHTKASGIKIGNIYYSTDYGIRADIEVQEGCKHDASELSQFIVKKSTHLVAVDHGYNEGEYIWDADTYVKCTIWVTFKI